MRIGLLTTLLKMEADSDSGIGLHYRVLADALAELGHEVHVVYPSNRPVVAASALRKLAPRWTWDVVPSVLPWPFCRIVRNGSWQRRALFERFWAARNANGALARACSAKNLEIVETHAFAAPSFFFVRRRDRPPVISRIATTTSQMAASSPARSRALRVLAWAEIRASRESDALVTHSTAHRDTVCALEGYDPAHIELIPLGIPDPGMDIVEHPPVGRVEFLFVGRFEERKGIDVLLSAIPRVAAAVSDASFILVGDHGDGRAWRCFCQEHLELIQTRVSAPGRVPDTELDRLYRACSVFVAPSRYESFGLIYLEAMSRGKPVIGCRVGGIPEVVAEGKTGLLSLPGDAASLAESMIRLATNPELRRTLGMAARNDFIERFSASLVARRSASVYDSILRSRRA
jgi:hypothetical protein